MMTEDNLALGGGYTTECTDHVLQYHRNVCLKPI